MQHVIVQTWVSKTLSETVAKHVPIEFYRPYSLAGTGKVRLGGQRRVRRVIEYGMTFNLSNFTSGRDRRERQMRVVEDETVILAHKLRELRMVLIGLPSKNPRVLANDRTEEIGVLFHAVRAGDIKHFPLDNPTPEE